MPDICIFSPQIIGGVVSAAMGGIIGFYSAACISNRNARAIAAAKLRASFAPAQAEIFRAQCIGEHDLREFFDTAFLEHTAAIEEFSPFVSNSDMAKYQQARDDYQKTIYANDALGDAKLRWDSGKVVNEHGDEPLVFLDVIEQKISNILNFSKPKNCFFKLA
ncbi:MAG: hypothetical protein WAW36_19570 [Methylovulum miyakonense]|uniref:hypothetical protein n=1 Tax=Methylovulum miyakonense TaxID=645578 RepID=UPI003BB6B64D